jgi:3-hydroxyacyl-CoA dehydrogenase / enoyl-CoA hydratase / 3-hydroxybutyryl-CoA epimerase
MTLQHFKVDVDADGIALVTWNSPGRSMNVIDMKVMDELEQLVERVSNDEAIKGAVITSGKETFCAGADLTMLDGFSAEFARIAKAEGEETAIAKLFEWCQRLPLIYRRLETGGKPWVAAINGAALGGGFELCLACHHRVAAQNPKTQIGLPEIKVGLFPGAGGTQRVARMIQPADALQFLLKGEQVRPERAKGMKLIDNVVPPEQLIDAAKEWIKAGGKPVAPWDEKGFKLPGGLVYSKSGMMTFPAANAIYRRETYDNYPAARAILQAVYEGLQVPFDTAQRIESRYFTHVVRTPEASAMIRSLFVSMQELNKGARRPPKVPQKTFKKVGIIGAGFMGASIGYVTAQAGIEVVLIDRDQESADKGKAVSDKLISGQISRGRAKAADRDALLARIHATADYGALTDCDLVIEAVFEDRKVKAETFAKAATAVADDIIFASNTSTLPITSLAKDYKRPKNFVGIHFFSPVERMMLVEIILGKQTSDEAVATALDYVRAIKKTPIVVNDSRGFYANRCVLRYLSEGHQMLIEGVPPAMIENAARMAGMPVGPLSLTDEVAVDLALKITRATEADLGPKAIDPRHKALLEELVDKRGRLGRKNGKGFYDYPEKAPKKLWPGLAELQEQPMTVDEIDAAGEAFVTELKQRFLVVQAVEAARTVEDGVIVDVREADVGSILGFGFAPFTGGTLSYIDMMGTKRFVELCKKLEKKHGPRFKPPKLLVDMAAKGESFYTRFPPEKTKAAA